MKHELTLEGYAFKIRPVDERDAAFIIGLRTDPELGRFLHETSESLEEQIEWMRQYFRRRGDYYFVLERVGNGVKEGVIALYNHEELEESAECGRWVLRRGSLAAAECMLLAYRMAFNELKVSIVVCRTVSDNASVVSFHDSCGIHDRSVIPGCFELRGKIHDAVVHRVDRETWEVLEPRLDRLAQKVARRIYV